LTLLFDLQRTLQGGNVDWATGVCPPEDIKDKNKEKT
jgi:hypothetical protein